MATEDTIVFHDDDDGYEDWVRRHNGYVLTTRAKGSYMLHDCECLHLGKDAVHQELTKKPRRCGNKQDLVAWTQQATGTDPGNVVGACSVPRSGAPWHVAPVGRLRAVVLREHAWRQREGL